MKKELLLKQKLFEKSIIENEIIKARKLNDTYIVRELTYDLILVEYYIMELKK